MNPIFDNIPCELKQYPQWVVWKTVTRKEGEKPTKPPYQPNGKIAKSNDPQTWSSFEAVQKAADRFDGIGFVLTKNDPFIGMDFDKCRCPAFNLIDPVIEQHVKTLNTYTEISPSGRGFRLLFKGKMPVDGKRKGQIELYQAARYVTLTGNILEGFPRTIENRQTELYRFIQAVFPDKNTGKKEALERPSQSFDPRDRLQAAFRSKNGAEIRRLWDGGYSDYSSQSEADLALCSHLGFWLDGDPAAIDTAFRESGLYRDKWDKKHHGDGKTYGAATIDKVISGLSIIYGDSLRGEVPQEVRKLTLEEMIQEATIDNLDEVLKRVAQVSSRVKQEALVAELSKKLKRSRSAIKQDLKRYGSEKQLEKRPIVENIEPWEAPVKGHELLNALYRVIETHVVLDHPALVACTLWTVLTYCYDSFRILPLLAITSPEKRCGKTTLLETLGGLANKPLLASSITPSAIFRTIEKYSPCLLIDEADTFIKDNDELRGVLNSGHTTKSAFVIRTNTETLEPERFSTWGPKAVSQIGALPDTLSDRSIAIRMGRKTVSERVKRVSLDFDGDHLTLRRMCKRWANDNAESLKNATPGMPETGNDRATDNWLPLICIADIAGKEWSERTRKAMLAIENVSDEDTITQALLRDIREILGTRERISSAELVEELIAMEDHPWGDWQRGKPITQNGLARLLKPFGILSKTIRIGENTPKGYVSKQFVDTFNRYLPPTHPIQTATTPQLPPVKDLRGFQSATQEDDVAVENRRKPPSVNECGDVADENRGEGLFMKKQEE